MFPIPSSFSPLNLNVWKDFVLNSDFEDASYVLDGLSNGVSPCIVAGDTKSAKRTCISAYERSDIIENYLAVELEVGAIGPFIKPPFTGTHMNHFGVIPKSTPGKWRWITDLLFPKGISVNDRIPDLQL